MQAIVISRLKFYRCVLLSTTAALCFTGISLLRAQSPYRIAVTDQESSGWQPATGFLKMGTSMSVTGDSFSYNANYLTKNGRPWYPVMGELHFSRVPARRWEQEILQMKAAGIQVISTYIIWNHHEEVPGVFDWKGNKDLRQFIALCKKHGMYVWLRPGPWVHAEVRNGGFPDWLMQSHTRLRTSDPAFMHYVASFFNQIGQACKGYWFKDGGPVIGVQIENELVFTKPAAYEYMKALKQLAIRSGMDVPYYSAFAQGPDNQDEFLYMMGSYPDSPWSSSTKKLYKPLFFIKPLEADADIGADLLGQVNKKVRSSYPKLSAEIGGGMQVTYHRRVEVSAKDVAANVLTKIASGLNGLGYYMYHGGTNPVGSTSLQESRETGYPNDVPLINYDFQAPIGAMGNHQQSYGELHLINLFLADFGRLLATTAPAFPKARKTSLFSTDTVQCSLRSKDGQGFLFLSNYQRYVPTAAVKGFQLALISGSDKELVPREPVTFQQDAYAIWPFHLSMEGIMLNYSTAQPLCILRNREAITYVFFGDGCTSFCLQDRTYQNYRLGQNCKAGSDKNIVICNTDKAADNAENKTASFDLRSVDGKLVHILVLPKKLALASYKFKTAGKKELLLITNAAAYQDERSIHLQATGSTHGSIWVMTFPALSLKNRPTGAQLTRQKSDSPFRSYRLSPAKVVNGHISLTVEKPAPVIASRAFADSIMQKRGKGKYFKASQPGPLYQTTFHDLPGQQNYRLDYDLPASPLVKGWRLQLIYQADLMAIYFKNKLVYDQFNYNDSCLFSPTYLLNSRKGTLDIQLLPGYKGMNVFREDAFKKRHPDMTGPPSIRQIEWIPVYDYSLAFN